MHQRPDKRQLTGESTTADNMAHRSGTAAIASMFRLAANSGVNVDVQGPSSGGPAGRITFAKNKKVTNVENPSLGCKYLDFVEVRAPA